MLDWAVILEKGVAAVTPSLLKSALDAAGESFKRKNPYQRLDFHGHLQCAYERCTKIKTIVNGDQPIDLLQSYVSLNFDINNKIIDGYNVIDEIVNNKTVVISGAAGSGKSMFMRYLWVSFFVSSRGKIPLFIELRALNQITTDDLFLFIYLSLFPPTPSSMMKERQDASQSQRTLFDEAVKEGQFIFILDGFDELSAEKRCIYEPQILHLSNCGQNVVVVSSRPDDRFKAWQRFLIYRVAPLNKDQVISLIESIDFDPAVKRKFITEMKRSIYDRHTDFVSRPLLATMMLLTFSSFADVPEKIHVFYDQAFDTLFARHDATKEAFKRKRHTDLSIDDFKRCLVHFA